MGLPQREGRPKLDISPEDSIPYTSSWTDDYDDVGMNPLNEPVPVRKGAPSVNGWQEVASDVTPTASTGGGKSGSEKR